MTMPSEEPKEGMQSQKIGMAAIKAARIAAGYRNMALQDYLTEVVLEASEWDIEQGHRDRRSRTPAPTEPPRGKRRKKGAE